MFSKRFASKNQLPGFYISGTLVQNGLIWLNYFNWKYFLVGNFLREISSSTQAKKLKCERNKIGKRQRANYKPEHY